MPDSRETLFYVLGSEEFHGFYNEYIIPHHKETEKAGDLLENHLEKLESPECRVAILGVQGAGKSSLLNSLVFGDEVLPVAVEETTCIPTMMRSIREHEKIGAEVHYFDGKVEQIPLEQEFLSKIVDNKFNPGNIMEVSHVLCRVESPFLKEGFVFVDLPGVGSLTERNEKTTMEFLRQTNIGIFLLRTVPPITDSEANFIRVAWPMIQESIFVQNLWAQETEKEIGAGMEHNVKVLQTISKEQAANMPEELLPVNIAMACQGIYTKDKKKIEMSGHNDLKKSIRKKFRHNYITNLHHGTAEFFSRMVLRARKRIKERLKILKSDHREILKKFEVEKEKYWKHKEVLENKVLKHCQDFQDAISEVRQDWLPGMLNETVDAILKKLDAMPLENLKEEDFRQLVRENFRDSFTISYTTLREKLAQCAEEYVDNLGITLNQMASLDSMIEEEKVYSEKDKKDPKFASGWSIALTGSLAPLLATGPAGWGILGGSLLTGGIVRWVSGATAHKRVMRGLRKALNDGKNKIREQMLEEMEKFSHAVLENIQVTVSQELEFYAAELERLEEVLQLEEGKQHEEIAKLDVIMQGSKTFLDTLSQV